MATVGLLLVALCATLGFLLLKARGELSNRATAASDEQHAERIATDYAVGAATINYQDLPAWITKLKANTAPAMSSKFDATAPKLQQILLPLKWVSSATPIAAKVESVNGSIYKVDVFVSVNSTTAQTPDGTQTTVTYNVTVDKQSDWKITDVGGTMAALTPK
ncbi:cytochrome d ubiquinol oxidase subunit II [Mycobacteroides chelonae]|nr:cytochrome d ubiquinol oxidase subunit II [Mycobacteroides chelonae]QQG94971.1 cytochrome d ubiquinol oxidase subunit II [Mycobacteroides chelonae]